MAEMANHPPSGFVAPPSLPKIRPYHPVTFRERGVAVPFTTPLLSGTRARPAARADLELVVPNPSGGKGVYVMPWGGVSMLCRPTLHDRFLNERIASLESVTPADIRKAARLVAVEGFAGEDASIAARLADESERGDRLVANYLLLMVLVSQAGGDEACAAGHLRNEAERNRSADESKKRARIAVDRIAPRLGKPVAWVGAALETLAVVLSDVGVDGSGTASRCERLTTLLRETCSTIEAWSADQKDEDQAAYADMICEVAEFSLAIVAITLREARALTADMLALLRAWAADASSVSAIASRPSWLLDGWEQICLIWTFAQDDAGRRSALVEMASLVPVLPREVSDWTGIILPGDVARQAAAAHSHE